MFTGPEYLRTLRKLLGAAEQHQPITCVQPQAIWRMGGHGFAAPLIADT
jgi:hypothetical protein